MVASAGYGRKVMSFVLRQKTPVMERIATHPFTSEEKTEFVLRVETELSAARARWVAGLGALCPQFAAVYGRDPDSFLRTLKQRADCVLSNTYVNGANPCPSQICGNGVPEPGEECDDGNEDNTDTCRTNCTSNPSP
jgi:cysteine-rich repeat protein